MKITMVTKDDGLSISLEADTQIEGMTAIEVVEAMEKVLTKLVELELLEDIREDLAKAIGEETEK